MDLISDVECVDASDIDIGRDCRVNSTVPCVIEVEGGGRLTGINTALLSPEVVSLGRGV